MEILKLKAVYKDYIWGGEKLRTKFGKDTDVFPLAESWELSCHKDGLTIVENTGETLEKYIKEHKGCLGTLCKSEEMPVLIKFIDAADDLSVQVHPNDRQAELMEGQKGKTEMWYVIDADKDAKITFGVSKDTTKEELKSALEENRIEELLNKVDSKKGDVFFVNAGTIHAIGKGNLIAEIQQNSNVTYRFYDYNRIGKDGKPRELHIEKALMVADCRKARPKEITEDGNGLKVLGKCEYFAVYEIKNSKKLNADEESYNAVVVTEGQFSINDTNIKAGETVFIPAGYGEYEIKGEGCALLVSNK